MVKNYFAAIRERPLGNRATVSEDQWFRRSITNQGFGDVVHKSPSPDIGYDRRKLPTLSATTVRRRSSNPGIPLKSTSGNPRIHSLTSARKWDLISQTAESHIGTLTDNRLRA
jgi:hypothetical protein